MTTAIIPDADKQKLQKLAIPLGMWAFVDTLNGVTCEQAFAEMTLIQEGMEPTLYVATGENSELDHGEVIDRVMEEVDEVYSVLVQAYALGANAQQTGAPSPPREA